MKILPKLAHDGNCDGAIFKTKRKIRMIALDAEFNGFRGNLISIALVPFDPSFPEFYRVVEGDWQYNPNVWVARNVIPFLGKDIIPVPREQAARELSKYLAQITFLINDGSFMSDKLPTIIADWPSDFTHMLELFLLDEPGNMISVVDFNMGFRSMREFNPETSLVPHNALSDARALRDYCVAN